MKLMILGYGGHGKDTVAEIIRDHFGLTFESSSLAALDLVIWPVMEHRYIDIELTMSEAMQSCFDDRRNNRTLWHELIKNYNTPDKARLARDIYSSSDMYVGCRCKEELAAIQAAGLFDHLIWVDASMRLPAEDESSMTIRRDAVGAYVIDNGGTLDQLKANTISLMNELFNFEIRN